MANEHDNAPILQKQITVSVDTISELNHKINQLESINDLFSVAAYKENTDFKKHTLANIALMMQELIEEIKDIFVKEIAES